jgi:hypothetical protein
VLDAIIRVKLSRGCHGLRGAPAPRLDGLFVEALRNADVFNDRGQDVFGVITQLRLGHVRARRHQRLVEDGEFADDGFVVAADERAHGHAVLLPLSRALATSKRRRATQSTLYLISRTS